MAAKKKKSKTNGKQQDNVAVEPTTHLAVQPSGAEVQAPVRARPRKKNKKISGGSDEWTVISSAWPDFGEEVNVAPPSLDNNNPAGSEKSRPALLKRTPARKVRFEGFEDDSPVEQAAEGGENNNNDAGSAVTQVTDVPVVDSDAPVVDLDALADNSDAPPPEKEDATVKDVEKSTEKYTNPKRKAALEEVRRFKAAVLVRVATWTFPNDTPFTPSPYPVDLYLSAQPSNTPDDNAMLALKRAFDAAIVEQDPTLVPANGSIPLHLAKRAARYVSGLLTAHDSQFRCAIEGLRSPLSKFHDEPLAPWVADMWEERLADSDRDWLLGKRIEDMDDEKAQRYVGEMMEFVFKYKAWGKMVEEECAEMGVKVFPSLG